MIRRLFWFLLGAAVGAIGLEWARRKVAEARETLTLASALRFVRSSAGRVIAALSGFLPAGPGGAQSTDPGATGPHG